MLPSIQGHAPKVAKNQRHVERIAEPFMEPQAFLKERLGAGVITLTQGNQTQVVQ